MIEGYLLLAIAIILAGAFIISQASLKVLLTIVLKGLASLSVVILGLYGAIYSGDITSSFGFLLVIGLGCCLIGDLLLQLFDFNPRENKYYIINAGSFAFMLAHIFFIVMFCFLLEQSVLAIVLPFVFGAIFTVGIYFMRKPMNLEYGASTVSILSYSFCLGTAVAMSFCNCLINGFSATNILLFIGFVMFLISDLILSLIYFKPKIDRKLYFPNLICYYVAIILIAFSIYL